MDEAQESIVEVGGVSPHDADAQMVEQEHGSEHRDYQWTIVAVGWGDDKEQRYERVSIVC